MYAKYELIKINDYETIPTKNVDVNTTTNQTLKEKENKQKRKRLKP